MKKVFSLMSAGTATVAIVIGSLAPAALAVHIGPSPDYSPSLPAQASEDGDDKVEPGKAKLVTNDSHKKSFGRPLPTTAPTSVSTPDVDPHALLSSEVMTRVSLPLGNRILRGHEGWMDESKPDIA